MDDRRQTTDDRATWIMCNVVHRLSSVVRRATAYPHAHPPRSPTTVWWCARGETAASSWPRPALPRARHDEYRHVLTQASQAPTWDQFCRWASLRPPPALSSAALCPQLHLSLCPTTARL